MVLLRGEMDPRKMPQTPDPRRTVVELTLLYTAYAM